MTVFNEVSFFSIERVKSSFVKSLYSWTFVYFNLEHIQIRCIYNSL